MIFCVCYDLLILSNIEIESCSVSDIDRSVKNHGLITDTHTHTYTEDWADNKDYCCRVGPTGGEAPVR